MKHLIFVFCFFGIGALTFSGCAMEEQAASASKDGVGGDQGDPWPEPDPKVWLEEDLIDPSWALIVEEVIIFEGIEEGIRDGGISDPPDTPDMKPVPSEVGAGTPVFGP